MITTFNGLSKLQKLKTVYTAGSFDLFHAGHVKYLQAIRKKYPYHKIVVGLLPDKRIASKKGKTRPIINEKDRVIVLDAIKVIDFVFITPIYRNGEDATWIILEKLKPDYVAFPQRKYLKLLPKFKEHGSQLVIIPRQSSRLSTTRIISKISHGN